MSISTRLDAVNLSDLAKLSPCGTIARAKKNIIAGNNPREQKFRRFIFMIYE